MDFNIKWKKEELTEVLSRKSGGKLEHDVRLWEAEAAIATGRTLEEWYKLPLIEREYIIATRLADKWIESLMIDDAVSEANKKVK